MRLTRPVRRLVESWELNESTGTGFLRGHAWSGFSGLACSACCAVSGMLASLQGERFRAPEVCLLFKPSYSSQSLSASLLM